MHRNGTARLCSQCMFNFIRTAKLFSKLVIQFCIPFNNVWEFQLVLVPQHLVVSIFFLVLISGGFNLYLICIWRNILTIFGIMSVQIFCPLKNWIIYFLIIEFWEFLYFEYKSFIRYADISSQSVACHFFLLPVSFEEQKFIILMKFSISIESFTLTHFTC